MKYGHNTSKGGKKLSSEIGKLCGSAPNAGKKYMQPDDYAAQHKGSKKLG